MAEAILSVRDLTVEFLTPEGPKRAVDGVSFDVHEHEVFGVVGESGSGKSVTMLAIMGLLPQGQARITGGEVKFRGKSLLNLGVEGLRAIRGKHLSMIFQDPMTSLNPVIKIGNQIAEAIGLHQKGLSRAATRDRVVELLGSVGVPNPGRRFDQYPHEFSGGMRQRAMIAMAIANDPSILIADEPTTALDVTIQAQVMEVLAGVRERTGAAMILITHDLGLVAETADRVAVMYGGRIAELAGVEETFAEPRHPYTVGLLASLPRLDGGFEQLYSIPGQPPGLRGRPKGCVFNPRCGLKRGRERCEAEVPALREVAPAHSAACHFSEEVDGWRREVAAVRDGAL